ncbi:MAG TPA: hypothetical protein VFT59_04105 [Candidatus Saccharimonadales bacterium]|nr:hypothetical protein [Candidatus Saccharimonadales bacterium]
MRQTGQGGSVIAFIIGGIILAAILGGGVYWVSQQGKTQNTPTPPITQQPQEQKPSDESTPTPTDQHEGNTPTQETTPEEQVAQLPSNGPTTPNELPATGPSDIIISSLVVGLIGGVAISYIRSRRQSTAF